MVDEPTKRFEMTRLRRVANAVIGGFVKYGVCPSEVHLLTTRGRKSGFLRTTPVSVLDSDRGRFLVSPYGEVGWVRNIRADGFATLRQGGWIELVSVRELAPEEAGPVLREYVAFPRTAVVAPYFEAPPEAPEEAFTAEADRHPVFEIVRSTTVRI
ncbi:nitroreductase family deazaflavin-dependent oxidoreductase [Nocardiopsis algeriensis]|uniref:Deazaflavin-dependent oxidoreductase (Nitroreductase family) n=1 Tax=Nocardiopsis algeriensis TaxID=1478215 RepID=A0A841IT52_9ACTN|nr:nitroreductase family deazaflavin-dependent oxidoreductase [Nocardiopsis algeriensis]MBB6121484.1 deazaflavin-dependent oxidoreductase (nitroreductase family) [Nocardiopsis algeriensis]